MSWNWTPSGQRYCRKLRASAPEVKVSRHNFFWVAQAFSAAIDPQTNAALAAGERLMYQTNSHLLQVLKLKRKENRKQNSPQRACSTRQIPKATSAKSQTSHSPLPRAVPSRSAPRSSG